MFFSGTIVHVVTSVKGAAGTGSVMPWSTGVATAGTPSTSAESSVTSLPLWRKRVGAGAPAPRGAIASVAVTVVRFAAMETSSATEVISCGGGA